MSDNGSGSDGGSGGGSGGGSNIREDIVASAVRFLTDPKVKGSSLAKKVSFLETKGLTAQEIDAALKQANNGEPLSTNLTQGSNSGQPAATSTDSEATTTSSLSPAQQHYRPQQQQQAAYGQHQMVAAAPPPVPPPRPSMDWKDYFIAAVVAGGVGYGLYVVIKKYVAPLLTISEEREAWKEERALMKEQNEETRQRLAKLEEGTENALEAIQGNSLKIQTAIDRMVELLEKLSRDQERRDTAMGRLESRLDSVQAKLTSEASGSSNGQGPSISDLQSDIRSLKSLLLSRRVPASTTGVSAATLNPASAAHDNGITTTTTTTTAAAATTPVTVTNGGGTTTTNGSVHSSSIVGVASPSIPSWQLGGSAGNSSQTSPNVNAVDSGKAAAKSP